MSRTPAVQLLAFCIASLLIVHCQLPSNPAEDPTNSTVTLFLVDGRSPVVEAGTTRKIGLIVTWPHHVEEYRLRSSCSDFNETFRKDTVIAIDTLYFEPDFSDEGACAIAVTGIMKDHNLKDRTDTLILEVKKGNASLRFSAIPGGISTIVGRSDTLDFEVTTVNTTAAISLSVTSSPQLDPSQLSVIASASPLTPLVVIATNRADSFIVTLRATAGALSAEAVVGVMVYDALAIAATISEKVIAGCSDTISFAVNNSSRPDPLQLSFVATPDIDPTVVKQIKSTADTLHILLTPKNEGTINLLVAVTNGIFRDTARYTVAIVAPESGVTMGNKEPPTITQTSGPQSGHRVTSATDSITLSITDGSGIDSVWWTLNGESAGTLTAKSDTNYKLSYTLTTHGSNRITIHARDKATAKNRDSLVIENIYNTSPEPVALVAPANEATGIALRPVFTWSGGNDHDGDTVFYCVKYDTSETTLGLSSREQTDTSIALVVEGSSLSPFTTYYWQVIAYTKTPYQDTVKSAIRSLRTAGTPLTFTNQPASQTVLMGSTVSLSVAASGIPAPTNYTWHRNDRPIDGATSQTHTISTATADDRGVYHVVVGNGVEQVTSSTATITLQCRVRFSSNGSIIDSQTVMYNSNATEPPTPTRSGYSFDGWYTSATSGSEFKFDEETISSNRTLYARWTAVYSVTYDRNGATGGTAPVDSNLYRNGQDATVLGNTGNLVITGYSFNGWNTSSTGTGGTQYNVGAPLRIVSADITLYAMWQRNTCMLTFDGQGATTLPSPASKTVNQGDLLGTLPSPPQKRSYVFDGWWTGERGTGQSVTSTMAINASQTVYAKWVIKDADVNIYTEVQIGNQVWMVENLKTTRYNDGAPIPQVINNSEWTALTTPGYCWYENTIANKEPYGALYNWHTVNTGKLAPAGWRVPTDADWNELSDFLGGNSVAGGKMKEAGAAWKSPNNGATNESGFSALPGGYRDTSGAFIGKDEYGVWSSTAEYSATEAYCRSLFYFSEQFNWVYGSKGTGRMVRLLRD